MDIEKTFTHCPRCGAAGKTEFNRLACGQCGLSNFFSPKPANALLAQNSAGEYLLVKRARNPAKDLWDVPGGFIDRDETIEQSMSREAQEELGVDISDITYFGSYKDTYAYQDVIYPVVITVLRASIKDAEQIKPADDASDYKYFKLQDFPTSQLAWPWMQQLVRDLDN